MSECEVREVDHAQLDVSVVVPLANERETLEELYSQIAAVLAQEERCFEVIFVDDGSADGSWEVIRRLHAAHENVRGIRFRRNFRKAAALAAGFAHARGAIVVTIDADLQDDPRSIVALLRKIAEGNDLVSGWKQDRKDPFTKRIASRLFNFVCSRLTEVQLHDFNCGLKAYRRSVVETLNLYGDLHRFIPALAAQRGSRIAEVAVPHFPRRYGKSHYGGARLLEGIFDLFTVCFLSRYLTRPAHVFGVFAVLAGLLGGTAALMPVVGPASLASPASVWVVGSALLLAFAGIFLSIGLLAELLTRLLHDRSASFVIAETLD